MLSDFDKIPTPLPPMLASMIGVTQSPRFWSIFYRGSKATWYDGTNVGIFSFSGVYQPLIQHIALDIYLWRYHLGSDDQYPTHAILCDRLESKMYVSEYKRVEYFLKSQQPPQQPLTAEEWEQLYKTFESESRPTTVESAKRLGMFEVFGHLTPTQQQERIELVHWLDKQVNEPLLRQYIADANSGNYNAIFALKQLRARIDAARSQ